MSRRHLFVAGLAAATAAVAVPTIAQRNRQTSRAIMRAASERSASSTRRIPRSSALARTLRTGSSKRQPRRAFRRARSTPPLPRRTAQWSNAHREQTELGLAIAFGADVASVIRQSASCCQAGRISHRSALHAQRVQRAWAGVRLRWAVMGRPAGGDEVHRVEQWMSQVGWSDAWGAVAPVSHLHGPSGLWVEERILGSLGVPRSDAWITDCLNTYRASVKTRAAVEDVHERSLAPMHCHPGPGSASVGSADRQ